MTRLAFVDTECTGLSLADEIWEFAAIIREDDGTEHEHQFFIEHDAWMCLNLPESFLADHQARYSQSDALSREMAAKEIAALLTDKIHIVGAVPDFDTTRIAILLRRFGYEPGWHHRLRCVETLAAGHFGREIGDLAACAEAFGIEVRGRHTALGDARAAMAIWDKVMIGA